MRGPLAPRPCACVAAALLAACASQPKSPYYGDERFLVVGVQPDAEADAVAEELEHSGFKVISKLNGLHFTALGAAGTDGAPAKVRIVTARGIALALDPVVATPLQPGIHYALMPPPVKDTHDADGDGFEEVFVHMLTDGVPPCILVYRVRDSGFADPVPNGQYAHAQPPGPPPWDAPAFCEDTVPPAAPPAPPAPAAASPAAASPAAASPAAASPAPP